MQFEQSARVPRILHTAIDISVPSLSTLRIGIEHPTAIGALALIMGIALETAIKFFILLLYLRGAPLELVE